VGGGGGGRYSTVHSPRPATITSQPAGGGHGAQAAAVVSARDAAEGRGGDPEVAGGAGRGRGGASRGGAGEAPDHGDDGPAHARPPRARPGPRLPLHHPGPRTRRRRQPRARQGHRHGRRGARPGLQQPAPRPLSEEPPRPPLASGTNLSPSFLTETSLFCSSTTLDCNSKLTTMVY